MTRGPSREVLGVLLLGVIDSLIRTCSAAELPDQGHMGQPISYACQGQGERGTRHIHPSGTMPTAHLRSSPLQGLRVQQPCITIVSMCTTSFPSFYR